MGEPKGKVTHYTEVPSARFGEEAPGTSIRWLIDEEHDGAPVFAMRAIEIEPGGHSPDHAHPYEHENYVLEGHGEVFIEDSWYPIGPGSVVFVPPGVRHQYRNTGSETFRFLCSVPVERLRGA